MATPTPTPTPALTEIYVVTHYEKHNENYCVRGPRYSFFALVDAVRHVKEGAVLTGSHCLERGIFQKDVGSDLFRWTISPNYHVSVHAEKVDEGKGLLESNLEHLRKNSPERAELVEKWKQQAIKDGVL